MKRTLLTTNKKQNQIEKKNVYFCYISTYYTNLQ
jgi:hypothetical protein